MGEIPPRVGGASDDRSQESKLRSFSRVGRPLPSGIVTFVFTDIEGSTRMIRAQGELYPTLLARHRELLRKAFHEGVEFGTAGDALFYAFERPATALDAAAEAQRRLSAEAWPAGVVVRVRIGVSVGSVELLGDDYVGLEVHRVARICAAAHGQQIIASHLAVELAGPDYEFFDLGEYNLAGLGSAERLYQLVFAGGETEFPRRAASCSGGTRELRATHDAAHDVQAEHNVEPADAARAIRASLPQVGFELRQQLTELAARFFAGGRASTYADTFVARIDREKLAERVSTQREMAVFSPYATVKPSSFKPRSTPSRV